MKVRVETITPETAKAYLQKNMINRNINEKRVSSYADDMKKGEWQLNGEAIRFNENGELIDGQHRLKAIIKANIPVQMVVMYEIDNSVSIYDRGRIRSVTDSLLIDGMDRRIATNSWVAVAKLHYLVQKGQSTIASDSMVKQFLFKNQETLMEIIDALPGGGHGSGKTKGLRVSARSAPFLLAAFYAYRSGESIEKISRFVEVFQSGFYNDPSEIAAIVCRNDAVAGNLSTAGTDRPKSLYKYEKAISDFCSGYPRKVSYNSWDKPIYSNNIIFKED